MKGDWSTRNERVWRVDVVVLDMTKFDSDDFNVDLTVTLIDRITRKEARKTARSIQRDKNTLIAFVRRS
jgi:hypothetical protein